MRCKRSASSGMVMSGVASTQPISSARTPASLPPPGRRPRRPGAAEPVASTRPSSLTAQLALTPNRAAAARRDDPACTAATNRIRTSIDNSFAMAPPPATVNQIATRRSKMIPIYETEL